MNTITELLNLEDSNILISDVKIEGSRKIFTVETPASLHFCPLCDFRMHYQVASTTLALYKSTMQLYCK